MREKKEYCGNFIATFQAIIFINMCIFVIGILGGIMAGTAWDGSNTKGKEMCIWAHEKPQSYMAYAFYSLKIGERVGCYIIEPRFNLHTK